MSSDDESDSLSEVEDVVSNEVEVEVEDEDEVEIEAEVEDKVEDKVEVEAEDEIEPEAVPKRRKKKREEVEVPAKKPKRRKVRVEVDPLDLFSPAEITHIVDTTVAPVDPLAGEVFEAAYPVPRESVDWTQYEQAEDDPITDSNFCLWTHAQSKQQYKDNKKFEALVRLHTENYGKMPPFDFVRMMQHHYNTHLRDFLMRPDPARPTRLQRWRGPAWPAQCIWNYTLTQVVLPSAVREDVARTYQHALHLIADGMLFLYDPATKRRTVDLRTLDAYNKLWDKARHLFDKIDGSRDTSLFSLG